MIPGAAMQSKTRALCCTVIQTSRLAPAAYVQARSRIRRAASTLRVGRAFLRSTHQVHVRDLTGMWRTRPATVVRSPRRRSPGRVTWLVCPAGDLFTVAPAAASSASLRHSARISGHGRRVSTRHPRSSVRACRRGPPGLSSRWWSGAGPHDRSCRGPCRPAGQLVPCGSEGTGRAVGWLV